MRSCDRNDSGAPALEGLAKWFDTPVGRQVARVERECVDRMIENSFGHFLLQMGCLGDFEGAFEHSRIRSRVVLNERPCARWDGLPLRAKLAELPLAPASVDALLLPHTLDFASQPQRVLREAERVLIPEGRILIIGFNPWSSWGLMRGAWRHRRPPWCGNQLTSSRLIDWLDLLGFQLELREWLLFRPPLRSAYSNRLDWIEETGARWWPVFGGVYVMRAVKRVALSTQLRPRWSRRPTFLPGGAVKPTVREGNHAR
jgi:SAM-dependent methyltransferase